MDSPHADALKNLAIDVFRKRAAPNYVVSKRSGWPGDIVKQATDFSFINTNLHPEIDTFAKQIFASTEFSSLFGGDDDLNPMLLCAYGGGRVSKSEVVAGMLSRALLQIYFLQLHHDEITFVSRVNENFVQLKRAINGEKVFALMVAGIGGVGLPIGSKLTTPWGELRPTTHAIYDYYQPIFRQNTSCVLTEGRFMTVAFDRAREPNRTFDISEIDTARSKVLLPLACALATPENRRPVVPIFLWNTVLLPFQEGFGFSTSLQTPFIGPVTDLDDYLTELERWAEIVSTAHRPQVEISAQRLVSAIGHRLDRSDSLVDAVTVWENLVGASGETTFRVTAALAKLLEPDSKKRPTLMKALKKVYEVRSLVVHGASGTGSRVGDAATSAIDIAARALRILYQRGPDWLSLKSSDRSDRILLE